MLNWRCRDNLVTPVDWLEMSWHYWLLFPLVGEAALYYPYPEEHQISSGFSPVLADTFLENRVPQI